MTPSLALLFLKLAGSGLQISGLQPSKKALTRSVSFDVSRSSWRQGFFMKREPATWLKFMGKLFVVVSLRRGQQHLPRGRLNRMAVTGRCAALALLQSSSTDGGKERELSLRSDFKIKKCTPQITVNSRYFYMILMNSCPHYYFYCIIFSLSLYECMFLSH